MGADGEHRRGSEVYIERQEQFAAGLRRDGATSPLLTSRWLTTGGLGVMPTPPALFSLAELCVLDAYRDCFQRIGIAYRDCFQRIGIKFADVTRSLLPISPSHFQLLPLRLNPRQRSDEGLLQYWHILRDEKEAEWQHPKAQDR